MTAGFIVFDGIITKIINYAVKLFRNYRKLSMISGKLHCNLCLFRLKGKCIHRIFRYTVNVGISFLHPRGSLVQLSKIYDIAYKLTHTLRFRINLFRKCLSVLLLYHAALQKFCVTRNRMKRSFQFVGDICRKILTYHRSFSNLFLIPFKLFLLRIYPVEQGFNLNVIIAFSVRKWVIEIKAIDRLHNFP